MRNLLVAGILFAVVVAGGLWFSSYADGLCRDAVVTLRACILAVDAEDWEGASAALEGLHASLREKHSLLAAFLPHSVLDDAERALVRTQAAAEVRHPALFRTECAGLITLLESAAELDSATLSNIF